MMQLEIKVGLGIKRRMGLRLRARERARDGAGHETGLKTMLLRMIIGPGVELGINLVKAMG